MVATIIVMGTITGALIGALIDSWLLQRRLRAGYKAAYCNSARWRRAYIKTAADGLQARLADCKGDDPIAAFIADLEPPHDGRTQPSVDLDATVPGKYGKATMELTGDALADLLVGCDATSESTNINWPWATIRPGR